MYLLDTDHISLIQKGGETAIRIQNRLETQSQLVRLSVVSFEEQVRGRLAEVAKSHSSAQQIERYSLLAGLLDVYCATPLLQFDEPADEHFQRLWLMRLRVGTLDLRIASIALANDATLLTRNRVDFEKVPGLRVEDWSV